MAAVTVCVQYWCSKQMCSPTHKGRAVDSPTAPAAQPPCCSCSCSPVGRLPGSAARGPHDDHLRCHVLQAPLRSAVGASVAASPAWAQMAVAAGSIAAGRTCEHQVAPHLASLLCRHRNRDRRPRRPSDHLAGGRPSSCLQLQPVRRCHRRKHGHGQRRAVAWCRYGLFLALLLQW